MLSYIIQTLSILILNLLNLLLSETGILKIPTILINLLVSLSSSECVFFILIHVMLIEVIYFMAFV